LALAAILWLTLASRSFKTEWLLVSGKSSALHKACLDGNVDIVRMLLEKGSPLDGRDDQGFTPLLAAASQRHFEIVKMLLELGANPSLSNESQSSLLHYLIRTEPPLTFAQRDMLRYCLQLGGDVNW
jgi:ankyrin repeat protein